MELTSTPSPLPVFPRSVDRWPSTPTEAQFRYARSLAAQKLENGASVEVRCAIDELSKRGISDLIGYLKNLDGVPNPAVDKDEAKPGYYLDDDDTVYCVVISKRSGHPYAKRLDIATGVAGSHASWKYAPGDASRFAGMNPLTATEAGRLGHLHGFCVVCCTNFDDPESVKWGIGPTCYKNLEGRTRPKYDKVHVAIPSDLDDPTVVRDARRTVDAQLVSV